MLKLLLIVVAVIALTDAKCRFTDQITPIKVDFDEVARKRFNRIYIPEWDSSSYVDHIYVDYKRIGGNIYNRTVTEIRKDGSSSVMHTRTEYRDGVINYSNYIYDNVPNEGLTYTGYILAKTDEGAMLLYSCSDDSDTLVLGDQRFIYAPADATLSEEAVSQLMSVDKKFNFTPNLFKLPHYLVDATEIRHSQNVSDCCLSDSVSGSRLLSSLLSKKIVILVN